MVRKIVNVLIWTPLAVLLVIFAVANRHLVTVSFDPFNSATPTVAVTLPLFIVIIVVAILGVVAGGTASWLQQGRWRRAARQHEAAAREARTQLANLHASRAAAAPFSATPAPSQVPPQVPPQVPALANGVPRG
jgi:uncharacterized integral membrane protein